MEVDVDYKKDRIITEVAKKYGVSVDEVRGVNNTWQIVEARSVAMYLMYNLLPITFSTIGEYFSRDYTIISDACQKIGERLNDHEFLLLIHDICLVLSPEFCNPDSGKARKEAQIHCIVAEVSKQFEISADEMRGTKCTKRILEARYVAMYLVRELLGTSLVAIGAFFSKDHSAVIYALRTVKERMESDDNFRSLVTNMEKNVWDIFYSHVGLQ